MAVPGVKYDDGQAGFATNCFPVRGLIRQTNDTDGAWLVAHRAEQRRRFKAVLCAKPRTYRHVRNKDLATMGDTAMVMEQEEDDDEPRVLDGFFLMKHCCVEDPVDLCSVNISDKGLSETKEDDFMLFDNVAYVNASENILPIESFKYFPMIRELEMPLNGLRNIKIHTEDFPHLEMLDLSYNNLSLEDILTVGSLQQLRVLHLSGNNLRTLPPDMAHPLVISKDNRRIARFPALEVLMLDDNKLCDVSTFAILAGLRKLRHLTLQKNQLSAIPHLRLVEGKHVMEEPQKSARRDRTSRKSSRRTGCSPKQKSVSVTEQHEGEPQLSVTTVTNEKSTTQQTGVSDLAVGKKNPRESDTVEPQSFPGNRPSSPVDPQSILGDMSSSAVQYTSPTETQTLDNGTAFTFEKLDSSLLDLNFEEPLNIETDRDPDVPLPPPFPQLRYLNLAYNVIEEEESVLACAAWPMLSELVIHDNPLTTQNSGDPPLLKRFLHERLAIKITRKKPTPIVRPPIEVPQKPGRKVKTKVPTIPKLTVDEILALEAPLLHEALTFDANKPLPPIKSPERPRSAGDASSSIYPDSDRPRSKDSDHPRSKESDRPRSRESDRPRSKDSGWTVEDNGDERKDPVDSFFMTQVNETEEAKTDLKPDIPGDDPSTEKKKKKHIPEKYKGFELLLDVDDEEENDLPKDIQGNIRALQYTLNHPLVYRDNQVKLDKKQKPFEPYRKLSFAPAPPRKTRQEKVDDVFSNLKTRSTVVEASLEDVLQDRTGEYKSVFPGASNLLNQVQRRYNAVRTNSIKDAKEAQSIIRSNTNIKTSKTKVARADSKLVSMMASS